MDITDHMVNIVRVCIKYHARAEFKRECIIASVLMLLMFITI